MNYLNKKEVIDILIRKVIDISTRHQRGTNEKSYLIHDLEQIQKCLDYIRNVNSSDKDEFIYISENSIINEMLLGIL